MKRSLSLSLSLNSIPDADTGTLRYLVNVTSKKDETTTEKKEIAQVWKGHMSIKKLCENTKDGVVLELNVLTLISY